MKKVRLFCNYDTSANIRKRFINNFVVDDDFDGIEYTLGHDYNVAVVFNNTNESINPKAKIIGIGQEPSWSPFYENNGILQRADKYYIHDPSLFSSKIKSPFEHASFMFYHDHLDNSIYDNSHKFKKTKKMSFIVSGANNGLGNYAKRLDLLKKILDSDLPIDIYGRGLNIADSRYKGELDYKMRGLQSYEYSIALENSNEYNYVTEKFVDCVLNSTIPVYNGAPNIAEIYTPKGFVNLNYDSPDVISDLREIIETDSSEMRKYTNINKHLYFSVAQNLHLFLSLILNDIH